MKLLLALLFYAGTVSAVNRSNNVTAIQTSLSEKQKIEMLISYVADLKGAVFIRNGSEHSPEEAAKHLRQKYSKAGSKVKTAKDFIDVCASSSSVSGAKYMIRTAEGVERPSRDLLMERLAMIEKAKK
jgi:hypothetical protein